MEAQWLARHGAFRSDKGMAIGAGTDVAIETAKVVLMKSDHLDVSRAVVLSRATVRKMKQNLAWASVHNGPNGLLS